MDLAGLGTMKHQKNRKLYWRICGHDGEHATFEKTVEFGQFTAGQMKQLLRALTAKAGLTNEEIVGAFAKRKSKIANDLLPVRRDLNYPTYSCGHGPCYTASVVDDRGRIRKHQSGFLST
jgi:hypothetical protein